MSNVLAKQQQSSDYMKRINNVISHIHSHLDSPLSLDMLASVAGFSPYHFHRIFKLIVKENL